MKAFTRSETLAVLIIILFTASITFYNLNISLRRARDAQRRSDLGAIANALNKYRDDFGFFPPSKDGKITACKAENFEAGYEEIKKDEKFDREKFFALLIPCEWGKDPLADVTDEEYEPYLRVIPEDPKTETGMKYLYLSNSNRVQIYSYLEGEIDEIGYDEAVVKRRLECGSGFICSFGKSHSVPVDISIEDYEEELLEKVR